MTSVLAAPILVPIGVSLICLATQRLPAVQRAASGVGAVAELGVAVFVFWRILQDGPLGAQVAGWPAPFGITLVGDLLSAVLVLAAGSIGASVVLYSLATVDPGREAYGYHTFVHVLLGAVAGAFLTGDLFNLYVWFEVLLVASFMLTVLRGGRRVLGAGLRYVALSLVGSSLFLAAAGTIYATVGSLNLADLSVRIAEAETGVAVMVAALLLFLAFGIKAAAFPLFHWLPSTYSVSHPAVSALFAGLLTKVGIYALLRVSTLLFLPLARDLQPWLLVVAGLTMVTGVLGALAQTDFRRLLAFHSISQVGYMLMGWALLTPLALAGAVYFLLHHLVVKSNLFLIGGIVGRRAGTYDLARLGGVRTANPLLAAFFGVSALSLAGVPPLSGFFAKLSLLEAGVESGELAIVATALAVGLLTLLSMIKLWTEAFSKPAPGEGAGPAGEAPEPQRTAVDQAFVQGTPVFAYLPVAMLALVALAMGIAAEPVFSLTSRVAEQLLDPTLYVRTVSGG